MIKYFGFIVGALWATGWIALALYVHGPEPKACDCWERKPMPFCEVLGLPVRGKIAVMPDAIVSTDP